MYILLVNPVNWCLFPLHGNVLLSVTELLGKLHFGAIIVTKAVETAAGLKCSSQATGQVTGYRSQVTGHRPQATGQVTGQVTGHRSQATGQVTGHPKNNRTLDKTVLD